MLRYLEIMKASQATKVSSFAWGLSQHTGSQAHKATMLQLQHTLTVVYRWLVPPVPQPPWKCLFPQGKHCPCEALRIPQASQLLSIIKMHIFSYPLASHALVGWHLLKILKSWFLRLSNVACSCFLQILIIWSDIALLAIKGLVINAAAQHSGQHHHDVRALNATSYGNRPWTKRPPSRLAAAVALYIPIHKWGPETS